MIGFSLGAYYALDLSAAAPEQIRSVVLFYGTGYADFSNSRAAYLGHFAEEDEFEPQAGVDELEEALKEAGRPVTFHRYRGTGHWFFEPDRPQAYNAEAAALAWDRTLAFLRTSLAPRSTSIRHHVNAPRGKVYRALIDQQAVARWMVPIGMTSQVHLFEAREGGSFRITLTYNEATGTGKTTAHSDTYHGHLVKLVPDERVVEVMEFETADETMRGHMTVTFTLTDAGGGTDLLAVHDNLPPGLSPADNETGWRMSLDKLAALVESELSETV